MVLFNTADASECDNVSWNGSKAWEKRAKTCIYGEGIKLKLK